MAWFGSVFALAVLAGSLASYAFHARAHYEGIDRALIVAVRAVTRDGAGESHFTHIAGQQGVALVLRVYENGRIQARTPGEAAPDVDPRAILARPAGPAYGFIPALAPSVVRRPQAGGTFGIIYD
ncbi:MAG: sensor histidine kinase, partial [Symbiobacteriaceae bacterium]